MSLNFTISTPLLDEAAIEAARCHHTRRAHLYGSLAALTPVLATTGFTLVVTQSPEISSAAGLLFLLLLLASVAPTVLLVFWAFTHVDKAARYKTLPPSLCEKALALAGKHPELENYRKLIAAARQFKHGDYAAMEEFDKNKAELDACKSLHQVDEPQVT